MKKPVATKRVTAWILLLAAAISLLAVIAVYYRDLAAARHRVSQGSRISATACGPIEYAEMGAGQPVLSVHGAGGGFDQGLLAAADLPAHGMRVIAPSRFGYLRTPLPPDASAAAQADAHACLMDALGVERAIVLGLSAGAPSSLQLALRHPRRMAALILIVPATYLPGAGGAGVRAPPGLQWMFDVLLRWDFLFWASLQTARNQVLQTMMATPAQLLRGVNAAERARVWAFMDQAQPISARRLGLLNDAHVTSTLTPLPLDRIRVPTLTMSAQDDGFATYERARYTAEQIPGARFVGYPSGGHLLVGRQSQITEEIVRLTRR